MKIVKVRLENERGSEVFFRELVLDGKKILVDAGRLNVDTRALHRFERSGERFESVAAAAEQFEKRIETDGRSFTKRTREVLEQPDRPEGLAPSAHNEALEAQVRAGGEAPAAVYADWLQSQGDLRGELAALHLAGKTDESERWMLENAEGLFGDLDVKIGSELDSLVWRDGFLRGASLKRGSYDSKTDLAAATAMFLALPVARLVTELRFGLNSFESDNDWTATMNAVTASRQAKQIRALLFNDYTSEDCEISWTPFGDFSAAWEHLPALEELHIRAGAGGTLGQIRLPSLRKLVRESGGLSRDEIQALVAAECPRLEHLEIWFGRESYGANGSVADIAPLLAGNAPSTLTHLGLRNAEITHELVEALATSRLLPQLRVLDLSLGTLLDADVDLVLSHAKEFSHLKRLDLSENLLDARAEEIAERLPGVEVLLADQRFDGEDERYAAVGE